MNPSEVPFGKVLSVFDNIGRIDSGRVSNNRYLVAAMDEGENPSGSIEHSSGSKKQPCSKTMTPLPEGFEPGPKDVICGRGRNIWNSAGNVHFRAVVESRVQEYQSARTKLEKSAILSSIVTEIRAGSPNGGFVRKDAKTGRWLEVGDFLAREKVSQSFRDVLHDSYRSSNRTKRKRRIEEQAKTAEINSELQREALEQLQSGKTDKNLYEIICQHQSMEEQAKRRRPSPVVREEHIHSDLVMRPATRLSDTNATASLPIDHDDLRPIPLSQQEGHNRFCETLPAVKRGSATLDTSSNQTPGFTQHSISAPSSFFQSPYAISQQEEMGGRFQSMGGSGMQGMLRTTNMGEGPVPVEPRPIPTGDDQQGRHLLDSLVAALSQLPIAETSDPFEPVPLPPDDLSDDIAHIFD